MSGRSWSSGCAQVSSWTGARSESATPAARYRPRQPGLQLGVHAGRRSALRDERVLGDERCPHVSGRPGWASSPWPTPAASSALPNTARARISSYSPASARLVPQPAAAMSDPVLLAASARHRRPVPAGLTGLKLADPGAAPRMTIMSSEAPKINLSQRERLRHYRVLTRRCGRGRGGRWLPPGRSRRRPTGRTPQTAHYGRRCPSCRYCSLHCHTRGECLSGRLRCRSLPIPDAPARPVRPDPAAITLPQRSRPERHLGDQASDLHFLVAGAGFEPATSGL
jgi:hypothetical protein